MAKELFDFKTRILYEINPKLLQNAINRLSSEGWTLLSENLSFDNSNFCSVIMVKPKD